MTCVSNRLRGPAAHKPSTTCYQNAHDAMLWEQSQNPSKPLVLRWSRSEVTGGEVRGLVGHAVGSVESVLGIGFAARAANPVARGT